MDVEFAPPRLNPVMTAAPGAPAVPGGQPLPGMTVATPTSHPGITLVEPPASASVQLTWQRITTAHSIARSRTVIVFHSLRCCLTAWI